VVVVEGMVVEEGSGRVEGKRKERVLFGQTAKKTAKC